MRYAFLLCVLWGTMLHAKAQDQYTKSIQEYLLQHQDLFNISTEDVDEIVITDNFISRHNGIRHIHIAQAKNGIRVINSSANVTINAQGQIVHIANRLIGGLSISNAAPILTPQQAIEQAATALQLTYNEPLNLIDNPNAQQYTFTKGDLSLEDIPVELVYWANDEHQLRASWSLSIYSIDAQHWWHVIIDAQTGILFETNDWVVHCAVGACGKGHTLGHAAWHQQAQQPAGKLAATASYRVYALPVESPSHGGRSLEIAPHDSLPSPFAWHDTDGIDGAEYTITRGNNVYAYEDRANQNAPGYSPDGGTSLTFDFPINLNNDPVTYQDAAITNLFYVNNRIHDITYGYGFDEAAGNFQTNNYGRGGTDNDEVRAEAQDGGGSNNANFATPPDGGNGRMQMYLWTANGGNTALSIQSPHPLAGTYSAVEAGFGGSLTPTPLVANLVVGDDGTLPDSNDVCESLTNATDLVGKIAVIRRGNCPFVDKVEAGQNAGAIAVIIVNNVPGSPIAMGGTNSTITIPSVMISQADGDALIAALKQGDNITGELVGGNNPPDLDGDLDNGIIVHEYAHGISNRLTGGPSAAGCLSNDEQMGEGWSDYFTCMLTMDFSQPNPQNRPIGSFAISNPPSGPGIRNASYDTSFVVNDYTYGDVNNGQLLSQPHGIGFVWATMLWDLTWDLMEVHGYDDDLENGTGGDNIALQLVMDGMKLQPCDPGFVDGRDAILLADQLNYGGVNQCIIWRAFARRGLGFSADQGSSFSRTDQIEAFDLPNNCLLATVRPTANFKADTTTTCTGKINFTDLSTNIPQAWLWEFGDGNTDTMPNPSHTYVKPGTYTVKLTVTNNIGVDSLVRAQYITYAPPLAPVASSISTCTGDTVTLVATATGNISWFDEQNNLLSSDTSLTVAPLTTETYFILNEEGAGIQKVGPADENFGAGSIHGTAFVGTVDFTTESELEILSAYVNAGSAGPRTVTLWDDFSGAGNVLQTVTITPTAGSQRIDLNFTIPGPGDYSIGLSQADLYRNNAGANYPYELPGVMSIVGSSAGPDFYYYFYDLAVQTPSCVSDTSQVTITVVDTVAFSYQTNNRTVDFTDLSGATSDWLWDFGDGSTSTDQNPQHTYASGGTYTVTLTIGSCRQSYDISIRAVGIEETFFDGITLTLQPNPTASTTLLSLSKPASTDIAWQLIAVDGRVVQQFVLPAGQLQHRIDLTDLASGVYYLAPHESNRANALRVVKLH